MKLVVDTNVLLSALMRNSVTRSILLNPNHKFYVPDFALASSKCFSASSIANSGIPTKDIKLLFNILLVNLEVVPQDEFLKCYSRAEKIMKSIDEKDVPFVALALCVDCEGIWSNDKDMKEQDAVKVWNTAELLNG
ncbi:MAG: PIN domain-containing protein [Thaumarchaeota archaeon]|nr:PIN domain-containing protein [Nitrososphaerota archaeon]MCL5068723.1 PIN domain-containing protein [Nitrososphaerota archaeon]